ncbi:hypothetical protein [Bradyrhizobium sp. SZCCHNPS2010]|uniref:hypothetical protein n=1 Tax=Bradyrhizobium sp. SZCCHNPS2010 TaxID=3057333 RepID=UPI002915D5CF|nr:hypothetical protein [Bradyrhizobium sp. SZCCHNPS2010]
MTNWTALRFQLLFHFEGASLKQFYYEPSTQTLNFGYGFNLSPTRNGGGGVDSSRVSFLVPYGLQVQDPTIPSMISTISGQQAAAEASEAMLKSAGCQISQEFNAMYCGDDHLDPEVHSEDIDPEQLRRACGKGMEAKQSVRPRRWKINDLTAGGLRGAVAAVHASWRTGFQN